MRITTAACLLLMSTLSGASAGCRTEQRCYDHSECLETEVCDSASQKCLPARCGDGIVSHGEACDDGDANSDTLPGACRRSCVVASCGDGVLDHAEECDDGTATGTRDSECHADCTENYCGDGRIAGGESCEATDLDGQTCHSVTGVGFGELTCTETCVFDTSDCGACGNGVMDGQELCDATDFGEASCQALGYDGGQLHCADLCGRVDASQCYDCGDGMCDVAKGESTQSCALDCGWVSVSAGRFHTCGLKADGSAWCWGSGLGGALGHGTTDPSNTPLRVLGLGPVSAVRASNGYSCARDAMGNAWCWGNNEHGVFGDGSLTSSLTPTAVTAVATGWAELALGSNFACGRSLGNDVYCWGRNGFGQLGTGDGLNHTTPQLLGGLNGVARIAAGYYNAWAVRSAGSTTATFAWGYNARGQSGTGAPLDIALPEQGLPGVTVGWIAGGGYHGCAVDAGGTWVRCWGANERGQLGDGTTDDAPLPVPADVQGYRVSGGGDFTCALNAVGQVRCWGANDQGQLGIGTLDDQHTAQPVTGMSAAADVSAGGSHACAVKLDGTLWCWGAGAMGQLGHGVSDDSAVPVAVNDPYQ